MRFTISRWMAATAILGANIGLLRAYLIAEQAADHMGLFDGCFLIIFALQIGLCYYMNTQGIARRLWIGFEICGLVATVALLALSMFDLEVFDLYTRRASEVSYLCLPTRVDVFLTNEHWDWFLAMIYFLPELLIATLGGLLAALIRTMTIPATERVAER
jgi:hypothetical protein